MYAVAAVTTRGQKLLYVAGIFSLLVGDFMRFESWSYRAGSPIIFNRRCSGRANLSILSGLYSRYSGSIVKIHR